MRPLIAWLRGHRRAGALVLVIILTFMSGMGTGFSLSFRLGYVLIIMLAVAFLWSRMGFARIEASVRRPNRPMRVGEQLSEMVEIANHGGLPNPWIEIEEMTDIPGVRAGRIVDMPGVIVHRRFEVKAPLLQRGEFTLGPLVVRSADPFGLFPNSREFQGAERLLVYPRAVPIPDFAMAHLNLSGDAGDRRRTHLVSPHVSSIRDYVAGDSMSRIHWPSTARQSRLMVKLFDQGEAGEVWIVFDQHASTVAGRDAESADEYGATIAVSAVEKYLGMQLPAGYVSYGSHPMMSPPVRGGGQLESITRNIATGRPEGDVPLVDVLTDLDPEIGTNTALVVITAARSREWVEALQGFARRGVNVTVALLDRESFLDGDQRTGTDEDSNMNVLAELVTAGIRTYSVKQGVPLANALTEPIRETRAARDESHESIRAGNGSSNRMGDGVAPTGASSGESD
ncbi:MAG: DUF58 domain-containing protein [Chloroflexi bacterium]|nr:DUF58 domain-containing protein [Chloroflexota bacterium]MCH8235459.1 DUF58 domain-containing protein [Chloroflexota bacterium]MCH8816658.1 DUF58 domain-containing protein [Chloroflexota bacterium]